MNAYLQGWGYADDGWVATGEQGKWGGRRKASVAGWRWPAWSSAGPATHTTFNPISADINYIISISMNMSAVGSQLEMSLVSFRLL